MSGVSATRAMFVAGVITILVRPLYAQGGAPPTNTVIQLAQNLVRNYLPLNIPICSVQNSVAFATTAITQRGEYNAERHYWPYKVRTSGTLSCVYLERPSAYAFDVVAVVRLAHDDFGAWSDAGSAIESGGYKQVAQVAAPQTRSMTEGERWVEAHPNPDAATVGDAQRYLQRVTSGSPGTWLSEFRPDLSTLGLGGDQGGAVGAARFLAQHPTELGCLRRMAAKVTGSGRAIPIAGDLHSPDFEYTVDFASTEHCTMTVRGRPPYHPWKIESVSVGY